MIWLTISAITIVFALLAILTGDNTPGLSSDSQRRMRARVANGGFPLESWQVY